jgi:hypothetical protein
MKRVSHTHRTSIETLRAIVEYLGAHPQSLDTEAAGVIGGASRQQVNAIRHLVIDTPLAIPKLLSGDRAADCPQTQSGLGSCQSS